MQVQLNTDANIQGDDALARWAERELLDKLSRFRERITRIEVHLSDTNAARISGDDKRCVLEARLRNRQPLTVSHSAGNVAAAFHGASDKLLRALDASLGRVRDARGRESIRGDDGVSRADAADRERDRGGSPEGAAS